MGFIYKITAPNGKSYYGQTIKTADHRWNQHRNAATRGDDEKSCKALNRAIRKYGWDNFKTEVVMECEDWELDEWEKIFIHEFNSLHPHGYNLTPGGAGCVYEQTEEVKEKRSHSLRKPGNQQLPMYIKVRNTSYASGYIVEKPGSKAAQFCSPNMSMDEKLELAVEYLNNIDSGFEVKQDLKRRNDLDIELPQYISYIKRDDGFRVKKPGHRLKEFRAKSETRDQRLARAIEYLNTLE